MAQTLPASVKNRNAGDWRDLERSVGFDDDKVSNFIPIGMADVGGTTRPRGVFGNLIFTTLFFSDATMKFPTQVPAVTC